MAHPRPTWRNFIHGMTAAAADSASRLESEGGAMAKAKRVARAASRQTRSELNGSTGDSAGQLSLLEPLKASIARLAVDRQAHMTCADNLDFIKSLQTGSMKLIVTSPPYNI